MRRVNRFPSRLLLCLAAIAIIHEGFAGGREGEYRLSSGEEKAVSLISAASMRGHLSFLASDSLEGRPTPSVGQRIAGEYIAAQFRRAGLEPVGDSGYFQTCLMDALVPNPDGFVFRIGGGVREIEVSRHQFEMDGVAAVSIEKMPLIKVIPDLDIRKSETGGKAIITSLPTRAGGATREHPGKDLSARLQSLGPAFVILLDRENKEPSDYFGRAALNTAVPWRGQGGSRFPGMAIVNDPALIEAFDAMRPGDSGSTITLHLGSPCPKKAVLRNVAGLLRGSDPDLRDSFVVVSAHYDGTGTRPGAVGDRTWNAANDNGSGTVSVIEIASALSALEQKPRRSILFLAFFGEELGSLGARYYVSHALVPIERTVVDLNLEQMGRKDSSEGDMTNRVTVTGDEYSDVGAVIRRAGLFTGIVVRNPLRESDPYFDRSDNLPFAEAGVPAHTVCVALEYPDYHSPGDEWEKIDYENMARTDRMVATALLTLAQSPAAPAWNRANPGARRFIIKQPKQIPGAGTPRGWMR